MDMESYVVHGEYLRVGETLSGGEFKLFRKTCLATYNGYEMRLGLMDANFEYTCTSCLYYRIIRFCFR